MSDNDGADQGPDGDIIILSDGETSDTLTWDFDSASEAFDFLAPGETLELTYMITVDDQNNVVSELSDPPVAGEVLAGEDDTGEVSTATKTVTILITGTNDVQFVEDPGPGGTAAYAARYSLAQKTQTYFMLIIIVVVGLMALAILPKTPNRR